MAQRCVLSEVDDDDDDEHDEVVFGEDVMESEAQHMAPQTPATTPCFNRIWPSPDHPDRRPVGLGVMGVGSGIDRLNADGRRRGRDVAPTRLAGAQR